MNHFKVLLNSGKSDIDARDEDELTPLHESIIQNHENIAMMLASSIITFTLNNKLNGSTKSWFINIFRSLFRFCQIKRGADVTLTEINKTTPYMLAASVEMTDVMSTIRTTGIALGQSIYRLNTVQVD